MKLLKIIGSIFFCIGVIFLVSDFYSERVSAKTFITRCQVFELENFFLKIGGGKLHELTFSEDFLRNINFHVVSECGLPLVLRENVLYGASGNPIRVIVKDEGVLICAKINGNSIFEFWKNEMVALEMRENKRMPFKRECPDPYAL